MAGNGRQRCGFVAVSITILTCQTFAVQLLGHHDGLNGRSKLALAIEGLLHFANFRRSHIVGGHFQPFGLPRRHIVVIDVGDVCLLIVHDIDVRSGDDDTRSSRLPDGDVSSNARPVLEIMRPS